MAEFIGVIDPFTLIGNIADENPVSKPLKQQLLIFDRVAIPMVEGILKANQKTQENIEALKELHWLIDKGLLFDPELSDEEKQGHTPSPEHEAESEAIIVHGLGMLYALLGRNPDEIAESLKTIEKDDEDDSPPLTDEELEVMERQLMRLPEVLKKPENRVKILEDELIEQFRLMMGHSTRKSSIVLREIHGLDAYPILSTTIPDSTQPSATKTDVVRIVLNRLPVPDDSTPWQDIVEYRKDPDSHGKFLALRNWMSDVARQNLTPQEVEEKLEHLLYEYQKHLEFYRIKAKRGTLETIIVASAEFLEDIANKRFSKLGKALFTTNQKRIELLEGELKAPGKEVAYIAKTQGTFGNVRS